MPHSPQTFFDFIVPRAKSWYSPKEVAAILGRSENFIRAAFENEKLLGHSANARAARGEEQRQSTLVHRDGVVLYLAETANYTPEDFLERVCALVENRALDELLVVQEVVRRAINAKSSRSLAHAG